jgi:FAD/FMN-containing dehydrogenase/SAM-dependent methyltransferase
MTQTSGLDVFRSKVTGQVIDESDPDYDTARSVWNGAIDHRPAIIVRCTDPADVAAAIAFGQARGWEISVRGGGHNPWGTAVAEGGLVIDLSELRAVSVNPDTRRAWCGGGATLADLDAATQRHGLAVPSGMISHTGVGGLTLGGGFGWLSRQAGLTVDNLLAAEVVTADGRTLRASADSHPDLFWALRGGGGNFGVVTGFEFQLHEVGPLVHLGLFFWGLEHGPEALRLGREVLASLPRAAGCVMAAGLTAPPAPFVPPRYHGTPGYVLAVAGFESAQEHAQLVAPVRAALPPLFEFVGPLPYVELQKLFDDAAPWGIYAYEKNLYLQQFSDEAITTLVENLPDKSSPMSFIRILGLGGAVADVTEQETAFGGSRSTRFMPGMVVCAPDAELLGADRAWARSTWQALLPYASHSRDYINFMADYDEDGVRASYGPERYQRLARIKARYDPDNVFHLNANIKPASQPTSGSVSGAQLSALKHENQLTPESIMKVGMAFWGSKTLLSAVELGIFSELASSGPLDAEALRERFDLHPRSATDFFDALVALGMLERENGRYTNTPETALFLDRAKPLYMGGVLELASASLYHHWGLLTESLRTGLPQSEAKTGEDLFEVLYADPAKTAQFVRGMAGASTYIGQVIAAKFPWQDYRSVIDVGCSGGPVPVQIALAHEHITGGGFDLPALGPIFDAYVAGFGLGERLSFTAGDFFTDPLPQADVLVMGHLLHGFDLAKRRLLLQKAYSVLPDGGALIVYDSIIDDERRSNTFGLLMSLLMLLQTTGGFESTGADYRAWMQEAGFRKIYVEHLVGPNSMVVGIK